MFSIKNKWLVVILTAFLALSTCALGKSSKTKETHTKPIITLSSVDDPDGDGDDRGIDYFPSTRKATGNRVFIFDPNHHSWVLYDENGKRLNTGKASGGKLYCPDVRRPCTTIAGEFKIIAKGGSDCISSKYPIETHGGAPMPYCMYFSPKGYAIHGSSDIPNANASHGCIRVTPLAAKWLNNNYMSIGTTVIVYPYRRAVH